MAKREIETRIDGPVARLTKIAVRPLNLRGIFLSLCVLAALSGGCSDSRTDKGSKQPAPLEFAPDATATDVYAKLLSDDRGISDDHLRQGIAALKKARPGAPPEPSRTPNATEISLAIMAAKYQGGAWRERLTGILGDAQGQTAMIAEMDLGAVGERDSLVLWWFLKASQSLPRREALWEVFLERVMREDAAGRPPPENPAYAPPEYQTKPPNPDWPYFTEAEIEAVMTRDSVCLREKQYLIDILADPPTNWKPLRGRAMKWIRAEADTETEARLKKIAANGEPPAYMASDMIKWLGLWLADVQLSKYVALGPSSPYARTVAQWVRQRVAYCGARNEPIELHLDDLASARWAEWLNAFPNLASDPAIQRGVLTYTFIKMPGEPGNP